jgi:hypothetical protein
MKKKTKRRKIDREARKLFDCGKLLFNAGHAITGLGVIGEERNCLIITLAAITRAFQSPVSVLVKGAPSTGKSTLIKRCLELHPPEARIERASLSEKALVHTRESLAHRILYLSEYRGGKDSRLLMRLLQSEGAITHEYTTIKGTQRCTEVAATAGSPVIFSLSIWVDETPAQTLAIVKAQVEPRQIANAPNLSRWHAVFSALLPSKADFSTPPKWLGYVAEQLPLQLVRVRRDWDRFLTLLRAVALTRRCPGERTTINIEFQDYCVARKILEPAMAATMHGVRGQELEIVHAVHALSSHSREVTARDIAEHLGWKVAVTYKHTKAAVRHGLLKYAHGARQQNKKPVIATGKNRGFLPKPSFVLRHNPDIGASIQFVDPFSGKKKVIRAKSIT